MPARDGTAELEEYGRGCWQQAALEKNGSAAALPPRLRVDGRESRPRGVREEALGGDRTGPRNLQNEGAAGKTDGAGTRCGVGQDERGDVQRHWQRDLQAQLRS